jgi:hypothetical protein
LLSSRESRDRVEGQFTYLGTIGSLGPLIGLIGTVYSMVGAFMEMANSDHTDEKKMAQTLSHGLVVPMLGIGLAVPAILFAAFFRNRLIGLANETSNVADDLLTQMYHNSKKPALAGDARPVATGVKAVVNESQSPAGSRGRVCDPGRAVNRVAGLVRPRVRPDRSAGPAAACPAGGARPTPRWRGRPAG